MQRSEGWFSERIGKVTSSKAPVLIGIQGKKEFQEIWDSVLNKKQEPTKSFTNFQRGIKFESSAAECFASDTGAEVKECGLFELEEDKRFGASPDRTFQGETCKSFVNINTGQKVNLHGLSLLEVKTRTEGCLEPLKGVTGAHVCQIQLQLKCAKSNACVLQSYVHETNQFRYFLITKDKDFINSFIHVCVTVLDNKPFAISSDNPYAGKLASLVGHVPNFENLLVFRQLAKDLARSFLEMKLAYN